MDANKMVVIAKVSGVPKINGEGDGKQAFFTVLANHRAPDKNGQWVDNYSKLPVFAVGRKADVVEKNVVDGQELYLEGRYQSWDTGNGTTGHAMVIDVAGVISLGFKPKVDKPVQQATPGGFPG
jgi:single-stranded DNA-binding protein